MLIDEIKKDAKSNLVKVFFDMDGVLVEYRVIQETEFDNVGFYEGLRPIKSSINFAKKLSKIKNVEVCILSNCRRITHKQDKIKWLKKYATFFKEENINIICYEEIENFDKNSKANVKADLILNLKKKQDFIAYHIDDDTTIIKVEKTIKDIKINHVSRIFK